jgi:predicted AAA+ superfamily ATPase
MQSDNLWWAPPYQIGKGYSELRRRAYFDVLFPLVAGSPVRRAILLMGPRRVGKTVLMFHCIDQLLHDGTDPRHISYLSVDHPIYNGCSLENFLEYCREATGIDYRTEKAYLFLDEIQYLREWEVHLKTLVDSYPNLRTIASGSAAAALRIKSLESGAGRFTDFLLPPLTFYEYLDLLGKNDLLDWSEYNSEDEKGAFPTASDPEALNVSFLHYLNFGGYPEVIFSETIQADPGRFIKSDIIDKVLLRDLPSLYGIQDIQELNYLFTTLAFNTANEISLEQLSQTAGVAKNTIKRYIEYLEAAFLIKIVHRIDRMGKRFQRANRFKVYLTNPSIRSALFSAIEESDPAMGALAETGIFSQWFHYPNALAYARWDKGEVDLVHANPAKVVWAVEVKWSDRFVAHPTELASLISFGSSNKLDRVTVTTRSLSAEKEVQGIRMRFVPTAIYCYMVGMNLIRGRSAWMTAD